MPVKIIKITSWITDQLSGRREQETGQGTDLAPDPGPNAIKKIYNPNL
jgi:hypothetical protein